MRRLLAITPDYPPFRGGIQLLLQRVIEGMPAFEPTVVTRDEPEAAAWDATRDYRIVRQGARDRRSGAVGPIFAGIRRGLVYRPEMVLAGHVLSAPAALALHAARGVPFGLYLYADELPNHRKLLILAMRRAAVTIAISEHTRALAHQLGAPVDRCVLIPPGVDLPDPGPVDPREHGLIVTVARLTDRYKGHDTMLDAMPLVLAASPEARWVVVGDGPLRPALEARAATLSLGPDAVHFAGEVSEAARDAWLARASVFCMPSRLPPSGAGGEGYGIVYLEAGIHGTPVVAGRVGGALDAVDDGKTGILVDPHSASALAEALISVIEDPPRAASLGAAGRAKALGQSWPEIALRVQDALLRGLEPPGAVARQRNG